MKLLFDQNLSFKLCQTLADLFPDSTHVGVLGLSDVVDRAIWDYAKADGLAIVSQDVDFCRDGGLIGISVADNLAARWKPINRGDLDPSATSR